MDSIFFLYIIAGAAVGLAVGITGVGGGSLMTPILLMFGFPPNIAIGTDLLYAAITKSGGVFAHQARGNINWSIVGNMAAGSIPAAIATSLALKYFFGNADAYGHFLTFSLGIVLVLTSLTLFFRQHLQRKVTQDRGFFAVIHRHSAFFTVLMGFIIGIFVTLSSVGAGAIGAAVLFMLYPHLSSYKIVGIDIAHAVPLTLIAGFAHLWLGNVDFFLLAGLLIGSLPAIHVGAHLSGKFPSAVLQRILALVLMFIGLKYVFF
ncbi:MAG: putative membrane protein YfcA [Cellvibrionaceae bacterium]|jgi:uncharacterized membrane protein YfcA